MPSVLPCLLTWLFFLAGCANGSPPGTPGAAEEHSGPRKLSIGSVDVHLDDRIVEIPGHVNMTNGVVELLACGPGGKTHESVFVLNARPTDLHAAFLLLGQRPGTAPDPSRETPPSGPLIEIEVSWQEDDILVCIQAGKTVSNRMNQSVLEQADWAFTGSTIIDGSYMAEVDESFVATFWDPWAVLNLSHPAGGDDTALMVNAEALPAKGSRVTFRFGVPR